MMHHPQHHLHVHQVNVHPQMHPQHPQQHQQHRLSNVNVNIPPPGPPPQQNQQQQHPHQPRDQNRMNHHQQQRIGGMSIHQNSGRQGGHMIQQSSVNQQQHHQPPPHQQQQKISQQQKHHQPKITQQQQQPIQGSMSHSTKNVIVPMVQSQQKQQPQQQHHQSQTQIHQQTNVVSQQTQRIIQAIETNKLTPQQNGTTAAAAVKKCEILSPEKSTTSSIQEQQQQPSLNQTLTNEIILANTKEKTPMCLVNELARFNKIQHQYRLTGEQGPAHKKRFTVTLKLGEEDYDAEGQSIKKAQHAAAEEAVKQTKYKHPPMKSNRTRSTSKHGVLLSGHHSSFYENGNLTPTVELNALAMKRGEPAVYLAEPTAIPPHPLNSSILPPNVNGHVVHSSQQQQPPQQHHPVVGNPHQMQSAQQGGGGSQQQQPNQFIPHQVNQYSNFHRNSNNSSNNSNVYQRFNSNYERRGGMARNTYGKYDYQQRNLHYNNYGPGIAQESYKITLQVGQRKFLGEGHTLQAARHDAASRALDVLKPITQETAVSDLSSTSIEDTNSDLKSPISLIHEMALKRNLTVQFEVRSEKGPPHMKTFITLCIVGTIATEGEGNGKKISKKRSAEKMLEELKKLPPPSPTGDILLKQKRKPQLTVKKKPRNLIKEQQKTEITEDVNPISRLIQIQQAKKEKEPIYTLIEERGAPRRREFLIEVAAGGHTAQGTGSNKKIAKRIAADCLLLLMGYESIPNPSPPSAVQIAENNNPEIIEKPRKVTFQETPETLKPPPATPTPTQGGSAGRQLVPGLLLMQQENKGGFTTPSKSISPQTGATIAKELLNDGTSPTADAIVKNNNISSLKSCDDDEASKSSPVTVQSSSPSSSSSAITSGVRPKDQLLYLADLLGFQIQFSDFPKGNHGDYLTLATLTTEPPQLCHGSGNSIDASHDQAAIKALHILSELGLDNVIKPKKNSPDDKKPPKPILSNGLKK